VSKLFSGKNVASSSGITGSGHLGSSGHKQLHPDADHDEQMVQSAAVGAGKETVCYVG
jgi:hypothetical protein